MLCYEKVDFLSFLMYELQNGFKMSSKLKNNYRSLKHRLWAFKWYIISKGIKKLIFWCTSFKNGSKSGLVVQRVQKSVKKRFSNWFPIVCVFGGWCHWSLNDVVGTLLTWQRVYHILPEKIVFYSLPWHSQHNRA